MTLPTLKHDIMPLNIHVAEDLMIIIIGSVTIMDNYDKPSWMIKLWALKIKLKSGPIIQACEKSADLAGYGTVFQDLFIFYFLILKPQIARLLQFASLSSKNVQTPLWLMAIFLFFAPHPWISPLITVLFTLDLHILTFGTHFLG